MKSDKSRETFHSEKHYSSVRLQQGRVLTDADWNEETDIERHRDVSLVRDMVGPTGVPEENDGFRPAPLPVTSIADFQINVGRMYVDGILVEQDTPNATYRNQPDLPPENVRPIPTTGGTFAAYLDVWDRHIGSLEDPGIREVALGGPDTTTRAKTVWQVKLLDLPSASPLAPVEDVEATPEWKALLLATTSTGTMRARARQESSQQDPCIIPEAAGFRRLENQLYRVEIHQAGTLGGPGAAPTFVWSRDNGSVLAQWIDVPDVANQLRVSQAVRDEALGFAQGQWIELSDDTRELQGQAGILVQILRVDGDLITYDPGGQTIHFADFPRNPKVRRWDSPGAVTVARNTGVNQGYIALEGGVEVRFEDGRYNVGDYWMIPARTITGSIEWPADPADPTQGLALLPAGIQHHLTPLVSFVMPNFQLFVDLRKKFPALTNLPTKGTEAEQPPRPGQFRYYLLDGDAGSNMTGVVGIDFDPAIAFAEARPFQTFTRILELLPHDGIDSTAIILIKPLASGDRYPDVTFSGIHGYRRFMIRGSNLVNDEADFLFCAAVPINGFAAGFKLLGQRVRPGDDFGYEFDFEVLVDATASPALPADETILNGARARFVSANPALNGFKTVVFRNQLIASDGVHNVIRLLDTPSGTVNPGDTLIVERPGARLNGFFVTDIACPFELIGLDIGAPFMGRMTSSLRADAPRGGVQFSFCRIGLSRIDGFHTVFTETSPRPDDLRFGDFNVGAGLTVETGLDLFNGELVDFNHYVSATGMTFNTVKKVNVFSGLIPKGTSVTNCQDYRFGSAGLPHLAVLETLRIQTSSGVLDHVLFNATDNTFFRDIIISGVRFIRGARPNLDILEGTVHINHLGVNLDLTEAFEADIFVEHPETAFLASGDSFLLPTGLFFPGNQLLFTNTIDFAGNRIRGPFGSLISGAWGSAVKTGAGFGFSNFDVVRFPTYDDTTQPPTGLVSAALETTRGETESSLRTSIAGVAQQGTFNPTADMRVMVVSSGYTLVNVASNPDPSRNPDAGFRFPAPIYLSLDQPGKITLTPNGIPIGVAFQFVSINTPNEMAIARLSLQGS